MAAPSSSFFHNCAFFLFFLHRLRVIITTTNMHHHIVRGYDMVRTSVLPCNAHATITHCVLHVHDSTLNP